MPLFRSLTVVLFFLVSSVATHASDTIVTEGVIDAPVSDVWDAWTTTAGLAKWLAPHSDIDLRIDGLMRAAYDPEGTLGDASTIENRILAYEPLRMLTIRVVKAPTDFPFKERIGDMWTVLSFQEAENGKTRLRIAGLGFGGDSESLKMKAFFEQGNAFTLAQLQKHFTP